ncbi:hypothetical protein ACTFIR_002754 [Dictyostelium discoideum]
MEEFFTENGNESLRQFLKNNNIENKTVETIASECERVVYKGLNQERKISSSKIEELNNLLHKEKDILSQERNKFSSKIEELNKQILVLSNKKSDLTHENYKLKQNVIKKIKLLIYQYSYSSSYSDYFSNKEKLQLVKMDCSFSKPFNGPLYQPSEEVLSLKRICKHSNLVPLVQTLMENMGSQMEFLDTHEIATIAGMFKPDWTVYTSKNKSDYFFCAGIGDTKKGNKFKKKHYGQIIKYMDLICVGCEIKTEINGFLVNSSQICFITGKKGPNQKKLKYEVTQSFDFEEGLIYLFHTFEGSKQIKLPLSLKQHMKKENCKDSLQFENQGKSSLIFSLDYKNQPKIIKWFHRNEEKETEYNTIKDLEKTIKESIPTITNHHKEWIEMTPLGILVDSNNATRSLFLKLTKLLKKVHALGYIHRDIRPSNVIVYDGEPYLIDWGFAIKINAEEIYQGTLMTASDRVLDLLIDSSVEKFSLKPSDDLVSLVKTMIVLKEIGVDKYIRSENLTHQQLKDYWISIQTTSFLYKKLLDLALNCDYQSIIKFLE